jgi:hypothetical protein
MTAPMTSREELADEIDRAQNNADLLRVMWRGKAEIATALRAGIAQPSGISAIAAERQRQISKEGWTTAHDDEHTEQALASAALCYVYASIFDPEDFPLRYWPWDQEWWKPSDARRNLVKAGALIAAEIERLDRISKPSPKTIIDPVESVGARGAMRQALDDHTSMLSSTDKAPPTKNRGTFLGYRNGNGEEMHCANAFCPHEIECRKGCINRAPMSL